ncbi:MAG: hypothetical protein AAGJ18_03950, partial [Bacteroidota bacterium]
VAVLVEFASILLFIGHWMDVFLMIKPGAKLTANEALAHHAGHGAEHAVAETGGIIMGFTIPGLLELGTLAGFLGLFLSLGCNQLSKASLVPKNDPYLGEALHHEVI